MDKNKPAEKQARKVVDWDAVTDDWRIGKLTERQMEEKHSVSRQAMRKRFTKLGITRDLSATVRAATKAALVQTASNARLSDGLVVKAVVNEVVQNFETRQHNAITGAVTEAVAVVHSHQDQAGSLISLLKRMTGELEEITDKPQSLEQIAEALEEESPEAAKAVKKLRTLTTRLNNLKTAGETLQRLVAIQRQAHGIDDDDKKSTVNIDSLLQSIAEEEGL